MTISAASSSSNPSAPPAAGLARVLCATDLSPQGAHAARQAAEIARASGGALALVTAVTVPPLDGLLQWATGIDQATEAEVASARDQLGRLGDELSAAHQVPVTGHVRSGHPVSSITAVSDELDADLICVSTRGPGPFGDHFIGTTAEKVAQMARRPVLLTRAGDLRRYDNVLVAVDFSPWSARALKIARRIAPHGTLHLVHALELWNEGKLRLAGVSDITIRHYREEARQQALQRLNALREEQLPGDEQVELHVVDGADPWMLIVEQVQTLNVDLTVIGKQGRSLLSESLLGSCTRMVLAESGGDVLISVHKDPG